ncbi:MAG: dephospho-CoA kinase [Lacipirellulaceae bacterium]
MKIIGLVGGVASGKSTVAAAFAELGAVVLDADKMAHAALEDPSVREQLVERWGDVILSPDGNVDRQAIAKRVFGEDVKAREERDFLEGLLHPKIRAKAEVKIAELADSQVSTTPKAVVIDAPLLLEAGWEKICEFLVFIDTPEANRKTRAGDRGWSQEDFSRRESAQLPIAKKRETATHIIDNSGSTEDLRREVEQVWLQIVG